MQWQTIGARFKSDEIKKLDKWINGESRNKVIRKIILTAIESGLTHEEVLTVLKKSPRLSFLSTEETKMVERILKLREEEAKLKKSVNELRNFENKLRERIIKDFLISPTLTFFTVPSQEPAVKTAGLRVPGLATQVLTSLSQGGQPPSGKNWAGGAGLSPANSPREKKRGGEGANSSHLQVGVSPSPVFYEGDKRKEEAARKKHCNLRIVSAILKT